MKKSLLQKLKKFKKFKKPALILVVFVLLIIGRTLALKKPSTDLTMEVKPQTLVDSIEVSGTYNAMAQTPVYSPTNGVITKIYVDNHTLVETNDSLFYVRSTATESEQAAAYAQYQTALQALTTAKQNQELFDVNMWTKQKALLDAQNNLDWLNDSLANSKDNPTTKQAYTDLEIESIKANVTKAEKEFRQAEKQYQESGISIAAANTSLQSAKLAYDATQSMLIKAPSSGTVVNLMAKPGNGVLTSYNSQAEAPVLIIASLQQPHLTAKISEAYIALVKKGQSVDIKFEAINQQTYTGKINTVDIIGTENNGIVFYNTLITIDQSVNDLRPGLNATVTIKLAQKNKVLAVPNSALIFDKNQVFVKAQIGQKTQLVPVKLGYRGLAVTEIVDGLKPNTTVVINSSLGQ